MGATTEIAWTDATWNPVVGCTPASTGCAHCYARELHEMRHHAKLAGRHLPEQYAKPFSTLQCFPKRLEQPMRWKSPRRIFVCSTADLFHPDVPDEFIARVWATMIMARHHTFQVLTKRPERALELLTRVETNRSVRWGPNAGQRLPDAPWFSSRVWQLAWGQGSGGQPPADVYLNGWDSIWPAPNVWLGVTVEDQRAAEERIPLLLQAPAAVRFLSCEPLVGAVDLARWLEVWGVSEPDGRTACSGIDWVIVGGESGANARGFDLGWARRIVRQCAKAGVACFVKQLGRAPIAPCSRCQGKGHHHGFGEHGHDPDWCLDCGGIGMTAIKTADRDGRDPVEWPEDLRVREFPKVNEVER